MKFGKLQFDGDGPLPSAPVPQQEAEDGARPDDARLADYRAQAIVPLRTPHTRPQVSHLPQRRPAA